MERVLPAPGGRVAIGLAAAVALYASGVVTPVRDVHVGVAVGHPATGSLSQAFHHWTAYGTSGPLVCLGRPAGRTAVERSLTDMRRAKAAALAAHEDPEAAIHAAARTSLVRTARRAHTTAPCRERVVREVRLEYAATVALLPDRATVRRGAALGHAAASGRAGPR